MISREAQAISKLFFIANKDGEKVPFIPNRAQLFFDSHETNNMIIAKARQKGFSSYILAKFGIKCLGNHGRRCAVISHEASSTQRLLDRLDYYMKHIRGPKPVFGRHSRNEMYFDKTDSGIYIGTAGAKAFGRGDTITNLHCSEYAWWESTKQHFTGVFQAVPRSGQKIIESTGKGRKNDFYFIWQHADQMGYTRVFWPWFADGEYEIAGPEEWKPTIMTHRAYLEELQHKHNLSADKMRWYEYKLRELREDLPEMQQEYPSIPEECFQATGGVLFPNVNYVQTPLWISGYKHGRVMEYLTGHPRPGFTYILGCDPSGGTGNDDAAITIMCAETGDHCLEFYNSNTAPVAFAELCMDLGKEYNEAFIIPEANNHGVAVVEVLRGKYPRQRIYKHKLGTRTSPPQYGWMNNQQSKHGLVGMMQDAVKVQTFHGHKTASELLCYEEDDAGRMSGKSDNLVIATGLAMLGLERFASLRGTHLKVVEPPPAAVESYMVTTYEDIMTRLPKKSTPFSERRYGHNTRYR